MIQRLLLPLCSAIITSLVWSMKPAPAPIVERVAQWVALPSGETVHPELVRQIVVERFMMLEQDTRLLFDKRYLTMQRVFQ